MRVRLKLQITALLVCINVSSVCIAAEDTLSQSIQHPQVLGFTSALKLAIQNDPELKYAFFNHQAEQEQDNIALSQLLPRVSLESSYNYSSVDNIYTSGDVYSDAQLENDPNLIERTLKNQSDTVSRVTLQQSLIDVSAWKAYSGAKEAVRKSQFLYTRAEQELIYRLSQAYLETLFAAQKVYINQEKLESLQLKLDQMARMNELGVGDRLNVLRATSSRDVAKSDLLQAKSRLGDMQNKLDSIVGKSIELPESWIKNSYQLLPNLAQEIEQDWIDQVKGNATVLAEMANVRSKEMEAQSSTSEHLPTVSFSLSYTDRNSDDVYADSTNSTASVKFSLPLYSGGRTSAQARQAEAAYQAAQARYEKVLSDKRQAIKLAVTQLESYLERLEALEESRKSSQAFLDAAERQADLSLGSQVDVLEARTELYNVRLEFAKTLSDYLLADLNLLIETGRLNRDTMLKFDQLFNQPL